MISRHNRRFPFIRPLVVAALVAMPLAGCDRIRDGDDAGHLERARQFEAKGDYVSAIIEAKSALQSNGNNADARLLLGQAFIHAGNGRDAEIALKQAQDLGVAEDLIAVDYGKAILLQGDYKRLLADVHVSNTLSVGSNARIQSLRGQAQLDFGRFEDADKSFKSALSYEPDLSEALVGLARIALAKRDFAGTTALLQRVLDRTPSDVGALVVSADVLRTRGNIDAAKVAYEKVLTVDPYNIFGQVNLTTLSVMKGQFDEAGKHLEIVRRIPGAGVMALYLEALLDYRKKDFAAARDPIQKVLEAVPEHLPSLVLAGANEYALGSDEQSAKYLRQALAVAPNILLARRVLAASLLRSGQVSQAEQMIKLALAQAPDDSATLSLAGEIYMRLGEPAKASVYLASASKADPTDPYIRTRLGLSRLAAGESQTAMADLEAVVSEDQQVSGAALVMIVAYINNKEYAKASSLLSDLEKKQPNNALLYNFRGGLLLAQKDYAGARSAFERALVLEPGYVPAADNLARLDVRDKRLDVARERYQAMVARNPADTRVAVALAEFDRATGSPVSETVAVLTRAIAADPKALKPLVLLSEITLPTEPKASMDYAQRAADISPNDSAVLSALGNAQLAVGLNAGALATYTRLVELQPNSPSALYRLAMLLNSNANPAGASRALRKAIELKPDYVEAKAALVSLELNANNTTAALKLARQIQSSQPKSPAGYVLEGDAQMLTKSYAGAAGMYEKAFSLQHDGGIVVKIHAAVTAAGRSAAADERMFEWLKQAPDDLGARYYLATAAQQAGNFKLAIEQYEAILRKNPADAVTMNDLAVAYARTKDSRALMTAESAYKLAPNEGAVSDTLGWLLVQEGDAARGVQILKQAAKEVPNAADVRMHLVRGLLKIGDKATARNELERLVNQPVPFAERREAEKLLAGLQSEE